jgi:hypothetical protein
MTSASDVERRVRAGGVLARSAVTNRTGWRSCAMIAKYRRSARTWSEIGGGNWRPLDVASPELSRPIAPSLPHGEKADAESASRDGGEPAESIAAEEEGFEPPVSCPTADFKSAALDRSATPPIQEI